jgi:hypothetical protein
MVRPWPCSVAPAVIIAPFRAGCLNAINSPAMPLRVHGDSVSVLPGVPYAPVPNQSMAARSHKGRS